LVKEKLASQVELEVAYTIGHPEPVGLRIDTHGTSLVREQVLYERARQILDLSVDGIIDAFELFQPLYASTAVGGFFGKKEFPWEQTE
jgi:S-adenosylmethionine synthetase